jgi:hypothetical protein
MPAFLISFSHSTDGFFAGQASLPEGKAEAATTPSAYAAADAGRDAITTPASTST